MVSDYCAQRCVAETYRTVSNVSSIIESWRLRQRNDFQVTPNPMSPGLLQGPSPLTMFNLDIGLISPWSSRVSRSWSSQVRKSVSSVEPVPVRVQLLRRSSGPWSFARGRSRWMEGIFDHWVWKSSEVDLLSFLKMPSSLVVRSERTLIRLEQEPTPS
jgi:hypothetical protein